MAIPSGKFYQKMTINGITKTWDLFDICESEYAGRGDLTTVSNYKEITRRGEKGPISYPTIPINAGALKRLNLLFYNNNDPIIIPKSGTFPSIYDYNNIPSYVRYESFSGSETGAPNVYNFEKKSDRWLVTGAVSKTYDVSMFHGGVLPDVVAILLQAAGGGGGKGKFIYPGGTAVPIGGSGGGSGATATVIMANSKFSISLGAPGAPGENAADSMIYDTGSPSSYIKCGGGGAGSEAVYSSSELSQSVGVGGSLFSSGWINNMGVSYAGVSGGKYNTNGETFSSKIYTVYDFSSDKYGFSSSERTGGLKGEGNIAAAGGGGGASLFAEGGEGGASTATSSASKAQIGAGGGGGNAYKNVAYDGGRGGVARAIVYFGYSSSLLS